MQDDIAAMMYEIRAAGGGVLNPIPKTKYTPLTYCIRNSSRKCFDHVMSRGANPCVRVPGGRSALWYAVRQCRFDGYYLREIMKCADPDFMPYELGLPYPHYIYPDHCEELMRLIRDHPNFDVDTDMTELVVAVIKMQPSLAPLALDTFKYNDAQVAYTAIANHCYDAVSRIVEHGGADIVKKVAVELSNASAIMVALRCVSRVTSDDVDDVLWNVFELYKFEESLKCLEILLTVGGRPTTTPLKLTLTHSMIYRGRLYKLLVLLSRHGVEVDGTRLFDQIRQNADIYYKEFATLMIRYVVSVNKTIEVLPEDAVYLMKHIQSAVDSNAAIIDIYAARLDADCTNDKKMQTLRYLADAIKMNTGTKPLP